MSSVRRRDTSEGNRLGALAGDAFADLPLPSLDRASLPSLAAEGVDTDLLADRLAVRSDPADAGDSESTDDSSDDQVRDDRITTSTPHSDAMSDADISDDGTDHELYRTAGADVDFEVPAAFEETLPSPNDIVSARARRHVLGDGDDAEADGADGADGADEADAETAQTGDDRERSPVDDADDLPETDTNGAPDTSDGDTESETNDEVAVDTTTTLDVELDPILAALLDRQRTRTDDDRSLGTVVADAVEAYLGAVLRDELTPSTTTTTVRVTVDGLLDETLTDAVETAGIGDLDAAVRGHIATTIADDVQTTVTTDLGRCASLLRAVHETHDAFDARTDVVDAAVERYLATTASED
jgi:hypothetical protein